MIDFYPQIKALHVIAVLASGSLFLLRGLLVRAGRQALAMTMPLRVLAVVIDVLLLIAALMLVAVLPNAVFANHWLTVKLVLLVLYIALGALALRRRAWGWLLGALAIYVAMLGIARAHHPLGWIVWITGG
jgi:uncharacterized membrane protein SirB2